jgi:hypothetical protein
VLPFYPKYLYLLELHLYRFFNQDVETEKAWLLAMPPLFSLANFGVTAFRIKLLKMSQLFPLGA